jgi:Na+/melibiose symporter-like transporter
MISDSMTPMNKYFSALLFGVGVALLSVVTFRLLLPWFTYKRVFVLIAVMIFSGSAITFFLEWRERRSELIAGGASRHLFWQGLGLFAIGVAWVLVSQRFLNR